MVNDGCQENEFMTSGNRMEYLAVLVEIGIREVELFSL